MQGHTEIIRLLLQQPNIDLNKTDDWNMYVYRVQQHLVLQQKTITYREVIQLLKDAGATYVYNNI